MAIVEINWQPTPRQLRAFGVALAVILAAWAGWLAFRGPALLLAACLAAAAGIAVLAALLRPTVLRLLYVGLCVAAWPIGLVVSWLLLGLVFYGLILPLGLLRRLTGRGGDVRAGFNPAAESYWTPRSPPRPPADYLRQW
jgi:hypothetical protein